MGMLAGFQLLSLLQNGRSFKRKELAERLEVSETSISYYISCMKDAGYNVRSTSGKYGGIQLVGGRR